MTLSDAIDILGLTLASAEKTQLETSLTYNQLVPEAIQNKIKKAYREKALATHPDKHPELAEEFKKVSAAYDVLSGADKPAVESSAAHFGFGFQGFSTPGPAQGTPEYEADQLKVKLDGLTEGTPEWKAARQELHDFLVANPGMGPGRYQTYLNQDGPDPMDLSAFFGPSSLDDAKAGPASPGA